MLIIGILAAIALPQYTKAVERSRVSEAVQFLGDAATAQSIFYMQGNAFATSLTNLNTGDITLTAPDSNNWTADTTYATTGLSSEDHGAGVKMTLQRNHGMYNGAKLIMEVYSDGFINKICDETSGEGFCALATTAGYKEAE